MMKKALVLMAIVGLASTAPQSKKLFSEHFEEFIDIIIEEATDDLLQLVDVYVQYEEFQKTLVYLQTTNFRDLIYEMESLPEVKAVINFLAKDNIDIQTFLDILHEMLDEISMKRTERQTLIGTNLSSFIYDSIAVFPQEKLAALFNEKMTNDVEFRSTIKNLRSAEWHSISSAVWKNATFRKEIQTLRDNGIELSAIIDEVKAIFGQRKFM